MGQQVMINTPQQPYKHYSLGAVNDHTGETLVLVRQHKRRSEMAQRLHALLDKHPTTTIYLSTAIEIMRDRIGITTTKNRWLDPAFLIWLYLT